MYVTNIKSINTYSTDCLWKSVNNSTVELAEINSSFGKVSGSIWDPGSQATRKPLELLSTPLIACFKPFILSCKEKLLKTTISNPQVLKWCMLLGIACLNKRIFLPWAGWDIMAAVPNCLQRLQQLHRNICGPVGFHLPKTCVRNRPGCPDTKETPAAKGAPYSDLTPLRHSHLALMLINQHQLLVTFSTNSVLCHGEDPLLFLNGWLVSWRPSHRVSSLTHMTGLAENHFSEEGSASQCWQWLACEEAGMEVGIRCLDRMDCLVWWLPVTCSSIEDDGVSLATVSWCVLEVWKKCINMDFYNF